MIESQGAPFACLENTRKPLFFLCFQSMKWKHWQKMDYTAKAASSVKKLFLKIFAILNGKHLCWSLFLIKLQSLTLFRMGFFGAAHTCPTMMKLGTVIP